MKILNNRPMIIKIYCFKFIICNIFLENGSIKSIIRRTLSTIQDAFRKFLMRFERKGKGKINNFKFN